jgi:lactoylglutathione lyase
MARQANATSSFKFTPGDDGPADVATTGYFVNHVALLVSNMTATREWYTKVFGMRHIFTVDLSEYYQIMYMGHSQGGRNGTGFQSGAEMNRDKNNMAGLMEFQTYKVRSTTSL